MVFPEHMEFRYYITPERKEHFALYDRTFGSRMTYLELTQALGQCLVDLYDTDFYDTYCTLSEINKLVRAERTKLRGGSCWSCRCRFARYTLSSACS